MAPPALPSQNQLYAYYLSRCGHHLVGKPNRYVVALLAEDAPSRLVRLQIESRECGVPLEELAEMEKGVAESVDNCTPLAQRTVLRLGDPILAAPLLSVAGADAATAAAAAAATAPLLVGARGMMPLLDLVAALPLLEELDLSNVGSWYASDAAAAITGSGGISGNDVVVRLCEVIGQLPALRRVDITSQPIGSLAAQLLLEAAEANPHLTDLRIAKAGVDTGLYYRLHSVLERNRSQLPTLPPPPPLPDMLPEYLTSLPMVDRKTLQEQQLLRAMLVEDSNFSAVLRAEQLSALVLHARVMSGQEVVARCGGRGVRGDGVHLFIVKSGVIRAFTDLQGLPLQRGDYFGDTYHDEVVFPTCRLVQEERGVVYALPLSCCGELLDAWGGRVRRLYAHFVSKAPLLQPLDTWTRVRLCCCCTEVRTYSPAEVVLQAGKPARSLWLVMGTGSFLALPGTEEDKVLTGRYDAYPIERLDLFGTEPLVSGKHTSSVTIAAGKDTHGEYECAVINGTAVRLVQQTLWAVLVASVRHYSLHEDLRQVAKRDAEWAYCI